MKPILIAGILGAGLLFTGCETTVVERDHHRGYGYRGDTTVVVDADRGRYDRGYDHRRDDYHGDYRTRNVNISETNVNRTVVNRTNVTQNARQGPRGNNRPGPQAQMNVQKKGDDKHKGHDKKKDGDHQ